MTKSKKHPKKSNKKPAHNLNIFSKINTRLLFVFVVAIGILGTYLIFNTSAAPKSQPAVTLSLSPSSQRVQLGSTLSLGIHLNTSGQNVNAAQVVVTYPASQLEYINVDAAGSAFTIDVPVSAKPGSITIPRANITPINNADALYTTLNFKAIGSAHKVQVKIDSTSQVLSSDTNGNILQKVVNGQYSIQ